MDETQVALLDQIGERQAAIQVMLGDADDQTQVVLDHLLPRLEVAGARRAGAFELLRGREQRALPDLVQVDLGDVVEEVGADAFDRHVERQLARAGIRLARVCRLAVVVGAYGMHHYAGGRNFAGSTGLPRRRISKCSLT